MNIRKFLNRVKGKEKLPTVRMTNSTSPSCISSRASSTSSQLLMLRSHSLVERR